MKIEFGGHELDDERARFDFGRCHAWLTRAYWSEGITRVEVERGFMHSTQPHAVAAWARHKWTLATADAHELYRAEGFGELPNPEQWMFLARPRPWLEPPQAACE